MGGRSRIDEPFWQLYELDGLDFIIREEEIYVLAL